MKTFISVLAAILVAVAMIWFVMESSRVREEALQRELKIHQLSLDASKTN